MQSVKLLDEAHLIKKYNEAAKRLLLFDYDVSFRLLHLVMLK